MSAVNSNMLYEIIILRLWMIPSITGPSGGCDGRQDWDAANRKSTRGLISTGNITWYI